jgi:alpha-N-arabinofuranosidase
MQHGPILVANNLFLSRSAFSMNSQGIAFIHNLIAGPIASHRGDTRATPFQQPHSTALAGMYSAANGDSGDDRFYHNLFAGTYNLQTMNKAALPCFATGNVFTQGAQPSKFDQDSRSRPDFNPDIKLIQKSDGWYLTISEDPAWRDETKRQVVTTKMLGQAKVSKCAYENRDGSPVKIDTDYFGNPRDKKNPFPGPFENPTGDKKEIKAWPISWAGSAH